MGKNKKCPVSGEYLNLFAVAAANEMARGLTIDEMNLLASVLGLISQALQVIESTRAICEPSSSEDSSSALPIEQE